MGVVVDLTNRIQKADRACAGYARFWTSAALSPEVKMMLYDCAIVSVALQNGETWRLTDKMTKKLVQSNDKWLRAVVEGREYSIHLRSQETPIRWSRADNTPTSRNPVPRDKLRIPLAESRETGYEDATTSTL